jgi:RNA polymerase sigma factor (sigma-70 family)
MIGSRKNDRSPALATLCHSDLLSVEEERRLFVRLKAVRTPALRGSGPESESQTNDRTTTFATHSEEAVAIRNRIVESNLRLVVSLAKHFAAPERSLEDLVSEASLPLIRCVESFDWRRGTRFSTYATRSLRNFFAKLRRQDCRRRSRVSIGERWGQISTSEGGSKTSERLIHAEDLRRLGDRLARLPPRERTLVAERFGLTGDRRPRTFRELGVRHGLSKERVRVITSEAISRLRESFDESLPP